MHTDMSFTERLPVATMLYAKDVPTRGGDTLLTNLYWAYESLSEPMKKIVDGLVGVYSGDIKGRRGGRAATMAATRFKPMNVENADKMEVEHPLVRRTRRPGGRRFISAAATSTGSPA